MKATIDANGVLMVQAETELEAYALERWSIDNMQPGSRILSEHFLVRYALPEPPERRPRPVVPNCDR